MKKITEEEIENIIDLYYNNFLKISEIAKKLNISRPIVSRIIKDEIEKRGKDIKMATITRVNTNQLTNLISLPNSFVEGIGLDSHLKSKKVIISVDKNKKEITIKRNKKQI